MEPVETDRVTVPKSVCFLVNQREVRSVNNVHGIAIGYKIGGFDATTASRVIAGSGLSSSAAYEVLVGTMVNYLYNDGKRCV